jgi:hypothetical protein
VRQSQILLRIAIDQENVGKRAVLDDAQLARIGIARTAHGKQLVIVGRRRGRPQALTRFSDGTPWFVLLPICSGQSLCNTENQSNFRN